MEQIINNAIESAVSEISTTAPASQKLMKKMTCFIRFVNKALPANGDKAECVYVNAKRIYKGQATMIDIKCEDKAYNTIMALNAAAKQRFDLKATFEGHYWTDDKGNFHFKAYNVEIAAPNTKAA